MLIECNLMILDTYSASSNNLNRAVYLDSWIFRWFLQPLRIQYNYRSTHDSNDQKWMGNLIHMWFHMSFKYSSWSSLIILYLSYPLILCFCRPLGCGCDAPCPLFPNAPGELRSRKPSPDTWIARPRRSVRSCWWVRWGLRNRARMPKTCIDF